MHEVKHCRFGLASAQSWSKAKQLLPKTAATGYQFAQTRSTAVKPRQN